VTFSVRQVELAKLNSLTKYPAIPTYHALDPRNGELLEDVTTFVGEVIGTEKIDGTNSRLILLPDASYILGSREELLYAAGDLIGNPAMGLVKALKPLAEELNGEQGDTITVFYVEAFGGKITSGSKQYTGCQRVSYRLFDVMRLEDYGAGLALKPEEISSWREDGGQPFFDEGALHAVSSRCHLPLTPRLFHIGSDLLPKTISETLAFLKRRLPESLSKLDEEAGGKPEGIVLRTTSRSVIAKARFEDYERTLRRRQ